MRAGKGEYKKGYSVGSLKQTERREVRQGSKRRCDLVAKRGTMDVNREASVVEVEVEGDVGREGFNLRERFEAEDYRAARRSYDVSAIVTSKAVMEEWKRMHAPMYTLPAMTRHGSPSEFNKEGVHGELKISYRWKWAVTWLKSCFPKHNFVTLQTIAPSRLCRSGIRIFPPRFALP